MSGCSMRQSARGDSEGSVAGGPGSRVMGDAWSRLRVCVCRPLLGNRPAPR